MMTEVQGLVLGILLAVGYVSAFVLSVLLFRARTRKNADNGEDVGV